jgi:hypothetical protein
MTGADYLFLLIEAENLFNVYCHAHIHVIIYVLHRTANLSNTKELTSP